MEIAAFCCTDVTKVAPVASKSFEQMYQKSDPFYTFMH